MKAAAFDYARPASGDEAVALLAAGTGMAKALGGGQSLGPMMNLRLAQPDSLVDLRAIAELRGCRRDGTGGMETVLIGACTTHADIEDGRFDDPSRGFLPRVAAGIAYRAVRNRGTVGGSLAHADPAADWVNAMAVAGADILVQGPAGRHTVAAAGWLQGAFTPALAEDEIVLGVRLAQWSAAARWSYYKFNRKTGEFAEAIAAFVVDPALDLCRGLIGALDGPPHVIADARGLLAALQAGDPAAADAELAAAGLPPGSYEHHIHRAALQRAAAQLKGNA